MATTVIPSQFQPNNLRLSNLNTTGLEKVPFQDYLEKSVSALQGVSNVEFENNHLIQQYVAGKASIDDVMISTSKLTLAMSLATTVVQNVVTTFKEIQNMPV